MVVTAMNTPARSNSIERLLRLDLPAPGHIPAGVPAERREWLTSKALRLYVAPAATGTTGTEVVSFIGRDGRRWPVLRDLSRNVVELPFDPDDALDALLTESWTPATENRRLSPASLNTFYRVKRAIPRPVQLAGRRAMIAWQGVPDFPRWPIDDSVYRLTALYAYCRLLANDLSTADFAWFWPDGASAALILTHDVEGTDGLQKMMEIADLEEELGFRSSFNLGGWYDVDPGAVAELQSRGFELGVHGIVHDRSLFASRGAFDRAQPALRALRERFGADGFRSPATHRVHDWLGDLDFSYDCSVPNSDPFEPQPGGSCTLWPFFIGKLVELPYTLPQDHTLFTLLRHDNPALWIEQSGRIEELNGLIQCVSHPDVGYLGDPRKRAAYREYLVAMAERPKIWRALPREVADWWRGRDEGTDERVVAGTVTLQDEPGQVTFRRQV
jgi:hypothetical protein